LQAIHGCRILSAMYCAMGVLSGEHCLQWGALDMINYITIEWAHIATIIWQFSISVICVVHLST
jgi:hypothetical protein